jgi:glutamine synthetase type III
MSSRCPNRSNRRSSIVIALVLSLAFCLGSSVAVAELQEWDQESVTKIADKLVVALKDLRVSVKDADSLADTGARASKYRVRQDLRLLASAAKSLASGLRAGEGREATLPAYRRMQTLRRDVAENGKRGIILADTLAKVEAVRGLLEELAPYYGE